MAPACGWPVDKHGCSCEFLRVSSFRVKLPSTKRQSMSTLRTPSNVERRTWSDEVFEPMEIKVHCTACNSQAKHVFSTAVYAPPRLRPKSSDSWDGFFTPTIFTCPNCGAQDAYRLTLRSTMAVAAAAISPQNEQVLVGLPGLWDGSIACRPTQAFAHLRTIAETGFDR